MKINDILDKIGNKDKDFRFMALSDLLVELPKESTKMEPEVQGKVCKSVLERLADDSGDIAQLAVRAIAALLPKISDQRLGEICEHLTTVLTTAPTKKDSG